MAQMNPSMYRNRLTDIANRLMVAIGGDVGEGRTGSFGLADANLYILLRLKRKQKIDSG